MAQQQLPLQQMHEVAADELGTARPSMHSDAELRGWATYKTSGFMVATGRVYNDRKGRWPDGRVIQTSVLLTPGAAKVGNVVATMKSYYLVVGPKRDLERARRCAGDGKRYRRRLIMTSAGEPNCGCTDEQSTRFLRLQLSLSSLDRTDNG
jgi:hypothetical protein